MNEQANNLNAVFMEVASRKMETQDKKIAALEDQMKIISGNEQLLREISATIEALRNSLNNSLFPEEKMRDLSARLDTNIRLLKQPLQNKILHHHHIPKIFWVAAGLFIALALVGTGWYSTANKLDQYIGSDTKYRSLRLDTAQTGLQSYLDYTDSLYNANSGMRKMVLEAEERNRINFERQQRAARLKKEARDLEKKVKE